MARTDQRLGEFGSRLASAALDLGKGCDQLPLTAVQTGAHGLTLSVNAVAVDALLVGADPEIGDIAPVMHDHEYG